MLEGFPSLSFSLSDWGLSSLEEVSYVSAGVLHAKEHSNTQTSTVDRLVPYHIRRHRPVVPEPSGARGKPAALEDGVFMIGHFRHGNTNRLGGNFNGFSRAPSSAQLAIEQVPASSMALSFRYRRGASGFAGFWIHLFGSKLPPEGRVFLDASNLGYLTFDVRGATGGEQINLQLADRAWEKREDSLPLGKLGDFLASGAVSTSWQRAWVPLDKIPKPLNRGELASLVFLVGAKGKGQVFLRDMAVTKKKDQALPIPPKLTVRSEKQALGMWLWETNKIAGRDYDTNQLTAFCKKHSVTDLFVQVPYDAKKVDGSWVIEWDDKPMRAMIKALSRIEVRIHALDGAAQYALPENHGRVLALVRRLVAYNEAVTPPERFTGVRFDIEPYLLAKFPGVHKERILKGYFKLLRATAAITKEAKLDFGVDIPFWFDGNNEFYQPVAEVDGRPASEHIIDIVDNIGIMDYRTQAYGADGVIIHAQNELAYAENHDKRVFIGLETVVLPDETIFELEPNGAGAHLYLLPTEPDHARMVWVSKKRRSWDTPLTLPKGARLLKQTGSVFVPASKLTFSDLTVADLQTVREQSERELRRYSSFYGFVIHSYESYRPWLERQKH